MMGYYELLQEILRPLKLYRLDSGPSGGELYAQGKALDRVLELLETGEQEAIVSTAGDRGLEAYEQIMPFVPVFADTLQRRQAIMALLSIDWCSFSLEALRRTLSGCGVAVELGESSIPETVEIKLMGLRGVPDNFEEIKWRIEQIIPCHLDTLYIFTYLIWQELEDWTENWQELERIAACWEQLEKYSR